MILRKIWSGWCQFWFAPVSPLPICIFRILLGILILQMSLVHLLPGLTFWYGPNSVVPIEEVQRNFWKMLPRFDAMLLLPPTEQSVYVFFWIFVLATVFMTIGFLTPFSTILVAIGLVSLHHHQPFNSNGGDAFMRIASIILCFSDCGRYWSIDRLIEKVKNPPGEQVFSNPWAQRLLQVQFTLVYAQSFFCKIIGSQWQDGTAVYYATRLDDMLKFNLPFLNNIVVCKAITWYTLIIEFFLFTIIWLPGARYYILLGALILHLGIDMSINLPVFEWVFISSLVLFIEPRDLDRRLDSAKRFAGGLISRAAEAFLGTSASK